jgi:hypothetical protein
MVRDIDMTDADHFAELMTEEIGRINFTVECHFISYTEVHLELHITRRRYQPLRGLHFCENYHFYCRGTMKIR